MDGKQCKSPFCTKYEQSDMFIKLAVQHFNTFFRPKRVLSLATTKEFRIRCRFYNLDYCSASEQTISDGKDTGQLV